MQGWKRGSRQGCQIVYFQTKNPDLVKLWSVLQWKSWWILWSFGLCTYIFYDLLAYFMVILVYCSRFCMLYQEKSGNPGSRCNKKGFLLRKIFYDLIVFHRQTYFSQKSGQMFLTYFFKGTNQVLKWSRYLEKNPVLIEDWLKGLNSSSFF
jgi:hypothetical protein